jgi:hypothetical protein
MPKADQAIEQQVVFYTSYFVVNSCQTAAFDNELYLIAGKIAVATAY